MKAKLEVIRYVENDVIATSGCPKIAGMSVDSYPFYGGSCGWNLSTTDSDFFEHESLTDMKYYDENGTLQTKENYWTSGSWGLDDVYFHYKEDATAPSGYIFEVCTDPSHHITINIH